MIGEELKQRSYYNTNSKVDEKAMVRIRENTNGFIHCKKCIVCGRSTNIPKYTISRKINAPFWYSRQCSKISYHYYSSPASIMANLKWAV